MDPYSYSQGIGVQPSGGLGAPALGAYQPAPASPYITGAPSSPITPSGGQSVLQPGKDTGNLYTGYQRSGNPWLDQMLGGYGFNPDYLSKGTFGQNQINQAGQNANPWLKDNSVLSGANNAVGGLGYGQNLAMPNYYGGALHNGGAGGLNYSYGNIPGTYGYNQTNQAGFTNPGSGQDYLGEYAKFGSANFTPDQYGNVVNDYNKWQGSLFGPGSNGAKQYGFNSQTFGQANNIGDVYSALKDNYGALNSYTNSFSNPAGSSDASFLSQYLPYLKG